ncbi:uncharacterized protein LOC105767271 [Gossypium raimondii]|uniref:uncharacterized protein LOC105767271 n=1 Tax=Gossypium raimondii TaxID=29730 RepID=UPI00063A95F3|nr:uncharacterized protein LOC105767271 [Gossypium raimondii]
MSCIQSSVSYVIFTKIIACETPKEAWDKLKEEFQGSDKNKQQQPINLIRDFDNLKIREAKTVKADRIIAVVNSIRLLGGQFSDSKVVKRYESKNSSLEDLRDLSTISLPNFINVLYAQEYKRASRQDERVKGGFQARACKQLSHIEKVCKNNGQPQQKNAQAQATDGNQAQEELIFIVLCLTTISNIEKHWLIDNGCTNHMTSNENIFKIIDTSSNSNIKVGNG